MHLEEQIQAYHELGRKIVELEQQKKELGLAILKQTPQKMLSIPGYVVRHYTRFSIKTSVEEARKVNATKTEEVVDKDKLKQLHQLGQSISGVSIIEFIQVFSTQEKTSAPPILSNPPIR